LISEKLLIAVMKKILLTLIVCMALVTMTTAQDPNFSQFFASPLTLNPALTGKFDGVYRVAGNYRDQWPAFNNAFVTKTASIDFSVLKNHIPEIDQFGVGVMGFTDRAGDGVITTNSASLSLAYHKGLDESGYHQLGAGFQGTYLSKRLDVTKVVFADQLTGTGFTGITSENFNGYNLNLSFFDLNAGILYNGTTNGYNNFYAGVSMYHINHHREVFTDTGNYYLPSRTTFQAGGKIPTGQNNYFHFSANHSMQANAHNTMIGGAYSLNVNNDEENPINVYLGTWVRFGDAIIPYVGLEFNELHIGLTYDINTSSLKPGSNMRGGGEVSLIYIRKPVDPNAKKLNCPKF